MHLRGCRSGEIRTDEEPISITLSDGQLETPAVPLHVLFEGQARRQPDRTAVIWEGRRVSYLALNERANRFAHLLLSFGVGPEDRVAVCLRRTPDLAAALLGILKAGACYVPLDPAYPHERLEFMLRDSGAVLLAADGSLPASLAGSGVREIALDDSEELSAENPVCPVGTDQLAYVIYTSGSTGTPKGVAIEHRSAVALAAWAREFYAADELVGVLASTSVCFDLSVFELFVTLCLGGTVVLADHALALKDLPDRELVTLINTVPSAITELLRIDGVPASVRTINLAGEPLSSDLVDQLYERTAAVRIYDLYGPSEDTTYSTVALRQPHAPATIGRPLPGTQAYILDEDLRLVSPGIAGELYLTGAGLARGYLHRPELNAQRFLPCPYSALPGARMYRTGDLARRRPDGQLEYLGRLDQQVKIRGYRIELGEIEAAIRRHPGIRDCVVAAREADDGDRRLVAYLVGEAEIVPEPPALREMIASSLPAYMIPSAFVVIPAVPLTPNGKVDRNALPAPAALAPVLERSGAPAGEVEQALAGIWGDILGLDRIGLHDDFFELGGHSLLAMRVLHQIRTRLDIDLPVRTLFEERTIAGLAAAVAHGSDVGERPPALPNVVTTEGAVPASQQQAALWFLDRIDPGKSVYNIPLVLRLKGRLVVDHLSTSVTDLVERHELLRSRLASVDGDVYLELAPPPHEALSVDRLEGVPAASRAEEAWRRAQEVADRPFDLAVGPLFRACLLRVNEDEHLLALSVHHAVADGRSIEILLEELSALYQGLQAGQPTSQPPLPARYADFCVWQREQLAGEPGRTQLDYWKRQLASLEPVLRLPSAVPRPPVFTGDGGRVRRQIPRELLAGVEQTARRHKVTPFMLLLAAYYALLHRYTSGQDLLVGTPVAGRSRRELAGLVGYFVNVLPLRGDLSGDPTFATLLERVRGTCLGALGSPDIPFARVVEALQVPRDAAYPPLVQACISLQDQFDCFLRIPGVEVELAPHDPRTAKFDLLLALERDGEELAATLEYYAGLFDPAAASRFLDHYCRLLEHAVSFPSSPISELNLLADSEREQVTVGWNATSRSYPDQPVHQLFEEQTRRTPDAVALLDANGAVSYAELNRQANRVARWLQAEGAAPGDVVGVFLERSPELVGVLLAILKLGAAYLPLDLSSPRKRLRLMVSEAGAHTVVSRQALLPALDVGACRGLCIEDAPASTMHELQGDLTMPVDSAALAYVMFTSGSTGKPKAVEIPHRAIVRLLFGADYCRFGPDETHLLLAPVSFDASTFELWGALLHGGRCALFPDALPTTDTLGAALREWGVTNLWLTASLFNFIIDEAPEILRGVRRLLTGGEALSVPHVRRALELLPDTEFVNGYGPTEGTTFTCCFRIPSRLPEVTASIPIGRPIGNTRVYVLDRSLNPAPVGVPGELYIAGDGLARGYRNDPELTAGRFVSAVIGGVRERLYRSGDLARWLADGDLEFLGRVDRQIKIRGHRIEPAEIEAALLHHPCVASARVLPQAAPSGELRLVAYVVPLRDSQPEPEAIRAYLATQLPPYLTPDRLLLLERLPLTANGKFDPTAFPTAAGDSETDRKWELPTAGLERELAGIWSELLGVQRIGRRDSFFDLGGHSLLAARLVSRLERTYGVRLSLRQILDRPSIKSLASLLESERKSAGPPREVIQPAVVGRRADGTAPLSFAQQRLWFLDQLEPGNRAFILPAVFRLSGDLQVEPLRDAVCKLVDRHEVLQTVILERAGEPVQVVGPPPECALPMLDLAQLHPAERERRTQVELALECERGFDLARGPLLRARLLRCSAEEHLLLVTQHHIISDGWSLDIIRRELEELYHACVQERPAVLPPMALQYRDFAAWQRQLSAAGAFDGQLDYWTRRLARLPPPLELPTDFPRPVRQDYAGGSVELRLEGELIIGLREVGSRHGATLFMTLLAAFAVLLQRWSGQDDLVIGAPIADRQYPELENLVGLCLNNLVLRIDLGGAPSFSELLGRVRTRVLEAFENPDTPFEQLVEVLQPARDTSRHPLFDVMFNYVSAPPPEPSRPGLRFEPVDSADGYSKLMLTLYAYVDGDAVRMRLAYQQALFGAERMGELLSQYGRLLEAVAADPDADVGGYRLTGLQVRRGVPDPTVELSAPEYEDVAAMLERVALRAPESVAVRHGERVWTYAHLRESILDLRAALHGIAPGEVVAVTGSRSFGVVAAVAGVLSSPGVLLTLDPDLPAPRRALMLREAAARVLLVVGDRPSDQETPEGCRVLHVDPETGLASAVDRGEPASTVHHGDDPAYVFFTSGSTGRPKGVVGRRKGLAHFLTWQRDTFRVGPSDRCAQLTGLSFDVVLRDLLLPLVSGAVVCLPLEEERLSHPHLLNWMRREGITLLHTVPSLARAWLSGLDAALPLPALRCVFFAGEPLTSELAATWRERLPGAPGAEIINLYGPTETTLAKCCFRVPAEPRPGVQPIGNTLPDTQILVLRGDHLCAPYETGELVIRTPFRSRGYLRPAPEDAARFVPNPFRDDREDLVYRSGDLGYYLPDGTVAILGRQDDQIKIRGVRIEPGEIAAALRSQCGVKEAAAVTHLRDGEPVLTAYLVASTDPPRPTAELRVALHASLPAYLVPSAFVWLPALPLTPNGKLDRRALPPPQDEAGAPMEAAASADELELRLLGIWRRTLGRPGLTVADDFFGAGGHSLLAVQLLTRVELELGPALPLTVLFQASTVAAFAEMMRTRGWESNWQALVPIQPHGSLPPLFLVHGIGGGVLCFRDLARRLGLDQPVYGLQAVTLGGAEREHERIEAMAAHYVRELRTVQPAGPYFLGGLSFGGTVALEMAQQLIAMGEKVALLAMLDTKAPGYPRFPGFAQRLASHLITVLKTSTAGRREYARVRLRAAKDQVRRRFLLAVSRRNVGSVDRTLGDIGILHIRAAHAYVRKAYPGMITLLRAEVQPIGCIPEPTNGWSELAQGGVEVLPVPGEHATIIEEPHVAELAHALTAALMRARGDA